MSADFLLAALVLDSRRSPDFGAGRIAIGRLTAEDIEQPDEFLEEDPDSAEGMAAIRATLDGDLTDLEAALGGREVDWMEVRGATVYVTGGMSYGDAPTELFATISRLRAVRGVLSAVGFERES